MTSYPFYVDDWMEHTRPTPSDKITTKEYRVLGTLDLLEFERMYTERTGLEYSEMPLELKESVGLTVYRNMSLIQRWSENRGETAKWLTSTS